MLLLGNFYFNVYGKDRRDGNANLLALKPHKKVFSLRIERTLSVPKTLSTTPLISYIYVGEGRMGLTKAKIGIKINSVVISNVVMLMICSTFYVLFLSFFLENENNVYRITRAGCVK